MMFEFKQDTAFLQGAFLSAQRQIQLGSEVPDRNLCTLSDHEVSIVTKLVTEAVALAKKGSWANEWEKPDALLTDMRAHATVFYTVLRSAGITCGPADKYYSALLSIFPVMDWSVYIALLKSCDWHIFFLECVNDIPDDACVFILENVLNQVRNNTKTCDYCVLNTVLQAIMHKLLGFKLAPKYRKLSEVPPKFCFPFDYVPSNSLVSVKQVDQDICQETTSDILPLSETPKALTFSELLTAAFTFNMEEIDTVEVLKVFLYGLVTFFDICLQMKPKDLLKKFDLIVPLISGVLNCIQSEKHKEMISLAASKFSADSIKKELVHNNIAWDVDVAYLSFLVCGGWKELSYYVKGCDRTGQESLAVKVEEAVEILCELLPLNTEDLSEKRQFLNALIFIADSKLIGINNALAIFIGYPAFLEEKEVMACLERNVPQPAEKSLVYSMLKVIMEQSISQKDKLIPIFFHAAKGLPVSEQQCMLQNCLLTYGLNENLKQQNFAKEMSPILNQTVNAERAEKEIILLCLQSPKECISIIVQQAVKGNSGQIAMLVKMLKLLSCVCAFRISQDVSLLMNELMPYFASPSLTSQQVKNMKIMVEELLQVLDDKDGLKPSELLVQCVLPCINLELSVASVSFPLEVTEIVLSATLSAKRTIWLSDLCLPVFIIYMGQIIDFSIEHNSGHLKERVVSVLDLLYELQQLNKENPCASAGKKTDLWIENYLSSVNPVVPFYIGKCIASYTSLELLKSDVSHSLDIMWLTNCIYGRRLETPMKEIILKNCNYNHSFLVIFLAQVLPHLTLNEWLHSAVLLEDCLELLSQNSHAEQPLLTNKNLRLSIGIEIFVDALLLLTAVRDVSLDWSYMVSSFSKVVSNKICNQVQELHLETLAALVLELCRLASHLEEMHMELITVPLLDIFKLLKKISSFTDGTTGFSTYVYAAVCALPDGVSRSYILGSMKAC